MTSFDGLLFTLISIGGLLIVISFFAIRSNKKQGIKNVQSASEQEESTYDEVRNKILELNEYGEYLKSELDGKHKELLFLYQMLNEKDKELREKNQHAQTTLTEQVTEHVPGQAPEHVTKQVADINQENVEQEEFEQDEIERYRDMQYNKKIIELSISGYSNQEIARQLNIGTGQVELVLNLFK